MADADIMALMQQQPEGGMPMPGAGAAPSPPPMPTPMATPEPKAGQKEAALINVSMALDLIEQSLPAIGSESPEGQQLMKAISSLTGLLGPKKAKTGELQGSEILQMLQNLPQAGGGSALTRAIQSAPPNLGAMGQPPGGAPPMPPQGGPPGMPPAPAQGGMPTPNLPQM